MATFNGKVVGGSLKLRASASTSASSLTSIPSGTSISVSTISNNQEWFSTSYGGHSGYVVAQYVAITTGGDACTVTTSSGSLNIRKSASTGATVIFTAAKGSTMRVLESRTGWRRVSNASGTGWGSSEFLTLAGDTGGSDNYTIAATVDTEKNGVGGTLNMRASASPSGSVVTTIPDGATIYVKSMSGEWLAAKYNSYTGYVMAKHVMNTSYYNGSTGGDTGGDTGGGTGVNTLSWSDILAGKGSYRRESDGSAVCEGVKTLQRLLKAIGYGEQNVGNIVVDGNFGSITAEAVKRFQTECGLTADSTVGKNTANKLVAVQTSSFFTDVNYYPLRSGLFNYNSYPYNEVSLVARIICAEHGYEGSGHSDGRAGVAKVLKNRKDRGGVTLYNSSKPRDYKNIIFGENQYTTATSPMAYYVARGSVAFEEAVSLARTICAGNTPSGAPKVTNQLYQKGSDAYSAEYQAKPDYCRYPETGTKYSFFYNK